ncbi:hypothetical protein [Iodobacter sp.]|uniref:hypothetical protein n=1 Tax=Iodobacter sp. TaxID=1915058 RepID=UPI0025E14629|nr:hypothetical protein [Iodobacter sp.]
MSAAKRLVDDLPVSAENLIKRLLVTIPASKSEDVLVALLGADKSEVATVVTNSAHRLLIEQLAVLYKIKVD